MNKKRVLRAIATFLSLALIHASFGSEAWAQAVPRVSGISAPVGGNAASAAGAASRANGSLTAASLGSVNAAAIGAASFSAASPAANTGAAAAPAAAFARSAPAASPAATLAPAAAAAPAASDSDAAAEAAPSAKAGGSMVARRFAQLRALFSGRANAGALPEASAAASATVPAPESVTHATALAPAPKDGDAGKVAQGGGDNAPPAPPSAPEKKSKGPWLGLGIAGLSIIAYMLVMQIGLEAQGVAMPQLTENAFKDFTLLPLVTVFASIGSMIGQPMTKFFTEKFGLTKTFYATAALRAVSLGAMTLLFGFGHMTIPLMMVFYAFNGIVTGISSTAEGTLRKMILAEKKVSQQTYRTWWQLLAESLAVPAPMIFGALVHSLGAVGAPLVTAVYPVTIMLGLGLAYILKVYPLSTDGKPTFLGKAAKIGAAVGGIAGLVAWAAPLGMQMAGGLALAAAAPAALHMLLTVALPVALAVAAVGTAGTYGYLRLNGWLQSKKELKPLTEAAPAAAADAPAVKKEKVGVWKSVKNTVSQIFRNMVEGKDYVMSIPYLKYSFMTAAVFDLFNIMIYRLFSPGYGKMTGGEAGLSAIQGNIVGMFSLGGLILSVLFITIENSPALRRMIATGLSKLASRVEPKIGWLGRGLGRLADKIRPAPVSSDPATADAAKDAAERSSMLRWGMAAIPAFLLLSTMALQIALPFAPLIFMGTNWVPSSAFAAALIPFGILQVAASIKFNSYYQEKLPHDAGKVQKALAFSGSAMTALSIVTMLILRPLFSAVNVFNPFPAVALTLIPLAMAAVGYLIWKLKSASKPDAVAQANTEAEQREQGQATAERKAGYVGMILGIVTAAVVITALPMIPGIAPWMLGLSVLWKFALNAALSAGLPAVGWLLGRNKVLKTPAAAPAKDAPAKP